MKLSVVRRALAVLFAVVWAVPGFGVIDLTVTWSPDWAEVLEGGWGLFFTLLVVVPFVAVGVRPRPPSATVLMLYVATLALLVSAGAAGEPGLVWVSALVAVETWLVTSREDRRDAIRLVRDRRFHAVSRPLAVLAAASAVPWTVYAVRMWAANREFHTDSDITNGIDHYAVQGALAVALLALAVLVALVPTCRRLAGRAWDSLRRTSDC